MVKEVERLRTGDEVSFRGSGAVRYRVLRVEQTGSDVHLTLTVSRGMIGPGVDVTAKYAAGELAKLHENR